MPMPPEITDNIAFFVDGTPDLLSLALASHTCRSVVIPRHLEYRVIRCPIRSPVWQHLVERPDLACNVRRVNITTDNSDYWSPWRAEMDVTYVQLPSALSNRLGHTSGTWQHCDENQIIDQLCEALRKMWSLKTFSWTPIPAINFRMGNSAEENIWILFQQLQSLKGLEFIYPSSRGQHPGRFGPQNPLWSISNLTSISILNIPYPQDVNQISCIRTLLQNSPNVESLCIAFGGANANTDIMFPEVRWPRLRRLVFRLHDPHYEAPRVPSLVLTRLLETHPTLEDVEWADMFPAQLKGKSLPMIRRLHGVDMRHGIQNILSSYTETPRAIENLAQIRLTPAIFSALETIDGNRLRRLDLRFFHSLDSIRRIADMFPALTWLRIPSVDYRHEYATITFSPIVVAEWPNVLSRFKQLEVFHGVSFFVDPIPGSDENAERAGHIAYCLPKLREMEHWDGYSNKIIELMKTPDGKGVSMKEVVLRNPADYYAWRETT